MIKHIWSILCKKSLIDKETNNISLIEVLEEISVTMGTPVNLESKINIPFGYEIVSYWIKEKEIEEVEVRVRFMDPDQKIIQTFLNKLSIPPDKNRMRSRFKIIGLELTKSGYYTFLIEVKEKNKKVFKRVAELPLEIKLIKKTLRANSKKTHLRKMYN